MNVTILQHSDGTPPGTVLDWAKKRGHDVQVRRLHRGDSLPALDETEMLVVLGGPMNVDDLDKHPWLADEKRFLKEAIARGTTSLGLCLGGQLLAQTLGAKVQKHKHWEVGWHPVRVEAGPQNLKVFQWHQDTFGLPEGAQLIATNAITENQGFAYRDHVVGFQFHPEATHEWVKELTEDKDFPSGPYVQDKKTILEGVANQKIMEEWFFSLLDRLEARTLARRK